MSDIETLPIDPSRLQSPFAADLSTTQWEERSRAAESITADNSGENAAGNLLKELESRQDEVLQKLDELDRRVLEVLRSCGVTLDDESDSEIAVETVPLRRAA